MQKDILSSEIVLNSITENTLVKDVCYRDMTSSTNDLARAEAQNGAGNGVLFIADTQTSGKGRFKRAWVSPSGAGIWATILLRPDMQVSLSTGYSILCGVAVARAINNVTGLNAMIKWPNDVIVNGKKVCGILSEMNNKKDKIDWIAIGFGVNVNIDKKDISKEISHKATSLSIESGKAIPRIELLKDILNQFEALFNEYEYKKSLNFITEEYESKSCVIGKQIEIIEGEYTKKGFAVGFNDAGALMLKTDNGIEIINYGEVSVRGEGIYA